MPAIRLGSTRAGRPSKNSLTLLISTSLSGVDGWLSLACGYDPRGVDFDLTAEQELLRDTVRTFAPEPVAPVAADLDPEAGAGCDAGAARTTAVLREGSWVVKGSKLFITNAGTDVTWGVTITARTGDDEVSNLVVENGTPGYSISAPMKKLGWRASDTR